MYNTNKPMSIWFLTVGLGLFFLTVFTLPVAAVDLPFDPNAYTFLVYNPGGQEPSIEEAMIKLGIPYHLRTSGNPVTPNDLATHDILIVGWNVYGYTEGLDANNLAAGITGRVVLSGHDLDFHTAYPDEYWYREAAEKMLIQSINYVLEGGGTGMITLGCTDAFPYLPQSWDVNAVNGVSEIVTEFTSEGLASGVYDDLEAGDMCGWGQSYHDIFTIEQGSDFVPFELGGNGGNDIITIARIHNTIIPPGCDVNLTKTDGVSGCIAPSTEETNSFINYQICFSTTCDINDVNIVDMLPAYVDYYSSDPCGVYNQGARTVTWNLGDLDANDSNCFMLNVQVASDAPQGNYLINTVKIFTGSNVIKRATERTKVCCQYTKIFVKKDSPGPQTGLSWNEAYHELRDALQNTNVCTEQIWVSAGTYHPTEKRN